MTLSVEGNISAGKSTFLRILEKNGLKNKLQVGSANVSVSMSWLHLPQSGHPTSNSVLTTHMPMCLNFTSLVTRPAST